MNLIDYTNKFMQNIYKHYCTIKKIKDINNDSKYVLNIIDKLKQEYGCDDNFQSLSAEAFLEKGLVKFQVLLSKSYSEYFYGPEYIMSLDEFINTKEIIESSFASQISDESVYTRIVNKFRIPIEDIPREIIQMLYISDEFMFSTNYILNVIHMNLEDPKSFFTIDDYRSKISHEIEKTISFLNDKGYYGTYEKDYLIELCISYKIGYPIIGSLYITSQFEKNPNPYENLKRFVEQLWDNYKLE